jgi:hypothetical protein
VLVSDGADVDELADRRLDGIGVESIAECGDDVLVGSLPLAEHAQDRGAGCIERENGGARHEIRKIAARGLKQMEFAPRQDRSHFAIAFHGFEPPGKWDIPTWRGGLQRENGPRVITDKTSRPIVRDHRSA